MNLQEYRAYFESILNNNTPQPPYDNPDYLDYTKMNWIRMNRWFKTGKLLDEMLISVKKINTRQYWIIITEPWCGDAAHNIPFIEMIANQNTQITTSYVLRDTAPYLIDEYLTNGTKSIPKLIIKNDEGADLGIWGPRPAKCQEVYAGLVERKADFENVKIEIQNWYNADKGVSIQKELIDMMAV